MRILDLSDNFIESIDGLSDEFLPTCKEINLANNNLESFPPFHLSKLLWLNLDNNHLSDLEGFEKGVVTDMGAVSVDTGIFTGRSPNDKFFIKDDTTRGYVAVSLGLMNARQSIDPIRKVVREAKYRPELLKQATQAQALNANPTPLIGAALLYLLLLLPLVRLVGRFEARAATI